MRSWWMTRSLALALGLVVASCGSDASSPPADPADASDVLAVPDDVLEDVSTDLEQPDGGGPDASGPDGSAPDGDGPDDSTTSEEAGSEDGGDGSDSEELPDAGPLDVPLSDTQDPGDGLGPDDTAPGDGLGPEDTAPGDGVGPDTTDPGDGVGPDTTDPGDGLTPGDVGPGDIGEPLIEPPDLVPTPACNAQTPRRFYDRIVQVGADGLLTAPPGDAAVTMSPFGPTFVGARPPTIRPGLFGQAELLVAAANDGLCTITGLDANGTALFAQSFAAYDCQSPALLPQGFAVLARVDLNTELRIFSDLGAPLETLSLTGSSPAVPVVVDGDVFVAHGELLSRFRPGVGVVASVATGLASITRLAQSDGLIVVTGRSSLLTEGLGDRLVRVISNVDGPPQLTALPAIELPGAALAETVLLDGCLDPLANGSSHWWCPGGLVASGGDGWLAVHAADTGELITAETLAGVMVTGLATLDDGRLVAAGAIDGAGAVVRALDLQTENAQSSQLTQLDLGTPSCVGSPVADSDGGLYVTQNNFLYRVATTAGGHGPGWSRPGGDAEGSGQPFVLGLECPGSGGLIFSRDARSPENETVAGGVVLANGDLVVVGSDGDGVNAPLAYAARYSRSGFKRWSETYPGESTGYTAVTAVASTLVAVTTLGQAAPIVGSVVLIDEQGQQGASVTLGIPGATVAPVAVEPTGDASVAVLAYTIFDGPDTALDATVFRVDVIGAPAATTSASIDWSGTGRPIAMTVAGDQIYVCGSTDLPATGATETTVTRIAADNTLPWNLTFPVGSANRCADLKVGPGGELLVLDTRIATNTAALMQLDASTGAVLSDTPLPLDYRRVVVPADGRPILASTTFGLARLDGLALDELGSYAVSGTFGIVTELLLMDGRPVLLGAAGSNLNAPDARLVRPAPFGQVGCARAGRCGDADCDDNNPCTIDGCDPATGACSFTNRLDGTVCAPGKTCAGGVCQ